MAQNKTRPTGDQVSGYVDAIPDGKRREGCRQLADMMTRVTGAPAAMWGASIVGFGRYHYRYDSGREGDAALVGFASRKDGIAVYLAAEGEHQEALLGQLGRHRMGKGCLTLPVLDQVDLAVLERLVADSVQAVRKRYPANGG